MFDRFEVSKVLVIGPLRVCSSVWPEELKKWDGLNFLRMSVMVGDAKQRATALKAKADVYVINRDNVKWLTDYLEKHNMPWPFDMVVIDELSSFKNHQSQRWRALRKARAYIRRIVGLTGTPVSNGLMDLWAETYLIDNGQRLGRFIGRYREAYFRPASMNPHTGQVFTYAPRPGAEEQIYGKISDISVSMKAADFLNMPDCVMVNHTVELEPAERKLYDRMKNDLFLRIANTEKVTADERDVGTVPPVPCSAGTEGLSPASRSNFSDQLTIDAQNAATLSNKLLQMANGAVYTDEREVAPIHTRKLDTL